MGLSSAGLRGASPNSHSLAARLEATSSRPSGFDYLRLILAISVVLAHSQLITGAAFLGPLNQLIIFIVPMFFALSGFLIAGSLERSKTLLIFLGLRVLRIAPALLVETILSALLLGPLLTSTSLYDYFRDPLFFSYFWNMVGHPQYFLPGVFSQNLTHSVNGTLWTLPWELCCYVLISAVALAGAYKSARRLILVLLLAYVFQLANTIIRPNFEYDGAGGTTLLICFISGVFLFRFRKSVPWSFPLFACMCVAIAMMIAFVQNGIRFTAFPVAYVTVYFGLMNPPRVATVLNRDISYGIFLYGFPLQQAVWQVFPLGRVPVGSFLLTLPLVIIVASISWEFVEKPALKKRGLLDPSAKKPNAVAVVHQPRITREC